VVPGFFAAISFVQPPINDHFGWEWIGARILRLHQGEELLGIIADASTGTNDEARMTNDEGMTKLE